MIPRHQQREELIVILHAADSWEAAADAILDAGWRKRQQLLTTQEVANLLNVSRVTVVKLLEAGEIPFTKYGNHRKVALTDLDEFRERKERRP